MARLVAPDVTQLKVLLAPEVIAEGFAVKELIVGLPDVVTVTDSVEVVDPDVLVAVRV